MRGGSAALLQISSFVVMSNTGVKVSRVAVQFSVIQCKMAN